MTTPYGNVFCFYAHTDDKNVCHCVGHAVERSSLRDSSSILFGRVNLLRWAQTTTVTDPPLAEVDMPMPKEANLCQIFHYGP